MIGTLATVVTALALVVGVVIALTTVALRTAVRVLLDLLTAAGLLRLAGDPGWNGLAGAAAIIALRQLLGAALNTRPPWSGRQSPARCAVDDQHLPLALEAKPGKTGG
ncbi:hypothetical protein [Micromonospora parathelypteridis]|uniref:DUF1622 domain-containing protein n=1 Tax=Micromonospora parathelypteridis TaxID=1839617 RepID=A0A840VYG5_9ACTN|nr:hypothetical protein [Micromonospora parathelypteridis]MBB5481697.1 hypothetical protein [Micromonospora parathelypteridis]GGO28600.1 hypothetical protein GCM10011576_54400 [Micromonospora parathelypteridis]